MEFFNDDNIMDYEGFSSGYYFGFQGVVKPNGLSSSSLVLDNEKGELVRAVVKPGGLHKVSSEEKAMIALRNHSEAERRRRERINGHLATLRSLIPGTNKMDKAALLTEVINQVKALKKSVHDATAGALVPTDVDEMKVEEEEPPSDGTSFSIRASLCCDFKQQLISDLREALESLPLKMVKSEIATLGSRMVNVFVVVGSNEDPDIEERKGSQVVVDSVRQALRSVLDKFYASEEFTSTNILPGKRRRTTSFLSPSNSYSTGDIW